MDKDRLKKGCMGIVNQLFDLAEVPVEKRQAINDKADEYLQEQFLRLFAVSVQCEHPYNSILKGKDIRPTQCLKCGKALSEH